MNILAAIDIYGGGEGSGCNPDKGRCGRPSSRMTKAIESHVPLTMEKRALAAKNEQRVAEAVKGDKLGDSKPFDVIVGRHGIEVKTILEGKNDKITVHPKSRRYKEQQARQLKLKNTYTVALDNRNGKDDVYVQKGIGAYRLSSMTKLGSINELRAHIV